MVKKYVDKCYLLLTTFLSISLASPISRFVIASTSNDFKESLTVLFAFNEYLLRYQAQNMLSLNHSLNH